MTAFYGQGYFHKHTDAGDRTIVSVAHIDKRYTRQQKKSLKDGRSAHIRPVILLTVLAAALLFGLWFDSVTASASSSGQEVSLVYSGAVEVASNTEYAEQEQSFGSRAADTDLSAYEAVTVRAGDSLWSIARERVPEHKDIRAYIYEMKEINQLESSMLYEGMLLLLP